MMYDSRQANMFPTIQPTDPPPTLVGTWYFKEDGGTIFIPTTPITLDQLMATHPPRCDKHHWHVELRSHEIKTSGRGQVQAGCCHCGASTYVNVNDFSCGHHTSGNGLAAEYQTAIGQIVRRCED
jgi:hypothetical protein